jgi:DNA-binding XRE family transcriptional regulator
MTFATQLKQARADAGLTQHQLAELLGVTPQTVYYWEAGKRVPPTEPSLTQQRILIQLESYTSAECRGRTR